MAKFFAITNERQVVDGSLDDVPAAEFTAVIASSHPLEKYGGRHRLDRQQLLEMAEAYRQGEYKFNFSHDPQRSAEVDVLAARVEPTEDGEWRLVIEFKTDQQTKEAIDDMTKVAHKLGQPALGMSYATTYTFAHIGAGETSVLFAADAATYSMDDIRGAAQMLPGEFAGSVAVAEYVEFSLADEIVNVVVIVQQNPDVHVVELGLIGTALTEAFKALWRGGKTIRYRIQIRRRNGNRTELVAEVRSKTEVQEFVDRIGSLEDRVNELESELWEYKNRNWIKRLRKK